MGSIRQYKYNRRIKKRPYWFPDNLPELAENGQMIKLGNIIAYQGTIIKVEMPQNPFNHWGLLYGYDKRGRLWIIDNTPKGIMVTDFREFTSFGKLKYEFEPMTDKSKSAEIMKRAVEFYQKRKYFDNRKNNCECFVNFCYGDIENPESSQSKITEIFANFFLTITEHIYTYSARNDEKKQAGIKQSFDKLRETAGLKRELREKNT